MPSPEPLRDAAPEQAKKVTDTLTANSIERVFVDQRITVEGYPA